jgi:AraC-like DNA-binding protein
MFTEIRSDYIHKYDLIRALLLEVMHLAMKIAPEANLRTGTLTASQRITVTFLERLEQQFPIDSTEQTIELRSAIDFAPLLNVHVNHLNRAVKETTGKTTTQIISERILQEAKILLRNTPWSVRLCSTGTFQQLLPEAYRIKSVKVSPCLNFAILRLNSDTLPELLL